MSDENEYRRNEYLAGVACRNPMNFVPKSHLDEIDRNAVAERKWRRNYRIIECVAYFAAFYAVIWILKR
jgi:hypothetical protein